MKIGHVRDIVFSEDIIKLHCIQMLIVSFDLTGSKGGFLRQRQRTLTTENFSVDNIFMYFYTNASPQLVVP